MIVSSPLSHGLGGPNQISERGAPPAVHSSEGTAVPGPPSASSAPPSSSSEQDRSGSGRGTGSTGEAASAGPLPPQDAPAGAPAHASTQGRKLAVLGLPWETEAEALVSHFSAFGVVQDAVIMRCRATGRSRGFGFVVFEDPAAASTAAAAAHTIDGRRADVRPAVPRSAAAAGGPSPHHHPLLAHTHARPPPGRLFVARIPPSVTEAEFRAYWEGYGSVVDAYLPRDPAGGGGGGGGSGSGGGGGGGDAGPASDGGAAEHAPTASTPHRGIGFVTFAEPASAAAALAAGPHRLGGADVAVDVATPKDVGGGGGGWRGERGGSEGLHPHAHHAHHAASAFHPSGPVPGASRDRAGGLAGLAAAAAAAEVAAGWGGGGPPPLPGAPSGADARPAASGSTAAMSGGCVPSASGGGGGGHPPGPRVFVGRVPPAATEADLRAHFGRFGFILDLYLVPARAAEGRGGGSGGGGGHRGFGFITYETPGALARLAAAGPHVVKGVALAIDAAVPRGGGGGADSGPPGGGGGGGLGHAGVQRDDGATSSRRLASLGDARPRAAYRPY